MKNKEIVKFLKPFVAKEKKWIVLAIMLSLVSSFIGITYGYFSGLAMNFVTENAFKLSVVILFLNLMLSILNNLFFERLGTLISTRMSFRVIENITFTLFHKVLKLPTKAFEEKSSGEFINRITNDSETITDAISSLIYIAIKLLASLLIFFYVLGNSLLVAFEILLYLVGVYILSAKFNKKLNALQKEIRSENDIYVMNVNESIRGIREVRALGINKNVAKNLKEIVTHLFQKRNATITYENNYYAMVGSLAEIFITIVFATIIVEIFYGKGSYTFLIAMTYYVYNFQHLVNRFATFSTQYQKLKVSVERIYEIVNNKLYQDVSYGKYQNEKMTGNIEFQQVSFHYHDNNKEILKDFNLAVKENTKVAII